MRLCVPFPEGHSPPLSTTWYLLGTLHRLPGRTTAKVGVAFWVSELRGDHRLPAVQTRVSTRAHWSPALPLSLLTA